ncbi:MAG: response regulator [Rhodospirillales bacterium]|nr:response regulator [Rhodospirillales bacterium]
MSVRILLVEDNPRWRQRLKDSILVDGIAAVDVAENDIQGFALGCDNNYAAIVVDLHLGGPAQELKGLKLIQKLTEEGHGSSIIILSGYFDPETIIAGYDVGALCFLEKESTIENTLRKFKAALRSHIYKFVDPPQPPLENDEERQERGGFIFDRIENKVYVCGLAGEDEIEVTFSRSGCLEVLEFLMRNSDPVTKEKISQECESISEGSVERYISETRKAFKAVNPEFDPIRTVKTDSGQTGYKIAP